MSDAEVEAHVHNLLDYNIEGWLDALGDNTFPTKLVPMTKDGKLAFNPEFEFY